MYHRERRKLTFLLTCCLLPQVLSKSIDTTENPPTEHIIDFENNIIDFDEDYSVKFNKKYGTVPWESSERFNKETHRYTVVKNKDRTNKVNLNKENETEINTPSNVEDSTLINDYSVIPLELISTTENLLASIIESTTEDLTVIPLSTTKRSTPEVDIPQTVTLPSSTQSTDTTTEFILNDKLVEESDTSETTTIKRQITFNNNTEFTTLDARTDIHDNITTTTEEPVSELYETTTFKIENTTVKSKSLEKDTKIVTEAKLNYTKDEVSNRNSSKSLEAEDSSESKEDVPNYSELDASEETEVPEDYYDTKDVLPTTAPKTDALSVIFGFAGSVVESVVETVAERVVPKSFYDLFKRMQKQNEALEAERLRSREENGGLGQFGRGILKTISTGLSKPFSQLMAGVKDIGSLDSDRGFVSSVASGVSSVANVANSVVDAFKDRVQAIYPGTVWCGDGHSAAARSSDLGLFFFTDTCCRQHDACKIYIKSGDTKYGLTNTGLFTRSHCSCDAKFRECLRKTNSLVSVQIGLTYFNVLGPQCFRKAHPIVKCAKRTRITGQKCEEYELDYTKPKMWQWFDNETF